MKQTTHTLITVFALIGMLLVFAPSHLRADEIKIMSKAFQMDDYVIVEPLFDNLSLNNEWKTSMESAEELEKDCPTEMTVETFLKYIRRKGCQTKLFGRITASLLEPLPKHVELFMTIYGMPMMR